MEPDRILVGDRRQVTALWTEQFRRNADVFEELGLDRDAAQELVEGFLERASHGRPPPALRILEDPSGIGRIPLLTEADPEGRAFMLRWLSPIMGQVAVRGEENLQPLSGLIGQAPLTLVANHISHLDAPAIFWALWNGAGPGRDLAERLVFLVGLFVSRAPFARLGLSLFGSILVCSPRDIEERRHLRPLMGRINHRAFHEARRLRAEGRVLAFFPEGTRSSDGRLQPFLASLYRYIDQTIVIPVRLHNLHRLLPNSGLILQKGTASVNFGKPVLVGDVPIEVPSKSTLRIRGAGEGRSRQAVMDELSECVATGGFCPPPEDEALCEQEHGQRRGLSEDR